MATNFNETAMKLKDVTTSADAVVAETRLHFDTLVQVHAEELRQSAERHAREKQQMRKHYRRMIAALAVIVCLCVVTAGAILYEFAF